jgi:hypothetical protein
MAPLALQSEWLTFFTSVAKKLDCICAQSTRYILFHKDSLCRLAGCAVQGWSMVVKGMLKKCFKLRQLESRLQICFEPASTRCQEDMLQVCLQYASSRIQVGYR